MWIAALKITSMPYHRRRHLDLGHAAGIATGAAAAHGAPKINRAGSPPEGVCKSLPDRARRPRRAGGAGRRRRPRFPYDEAKVSAAMKNPKIQIKVALGLGKGRDRVLTCDLTKEV
jgi:hypothetical protein